MWSVHPRGRRFWPAGPGGTPRVANWLLRRVRDFAQVKAEGRPSPRPLRGRHSKCSDVDEYGLDEMDGRVLHTLIEKFEGGTPSGSKTLAVAMGEGRLHAGGGLRAVSSSRRGSSCGRHGGGWRR